jgi:hypothetical protein
VVPDGMLRAPRGQLMPDSRNVMTQVSRGM